MFRACALLFLGLIGGIAVAADNGVYLGGGISQARVDVDLRSGTTSLPIDEDNTKFKLIAGVRPIDWFAVEVNYVDFGKFDTSSAAARGSYELKGFDAFAVGLLEIGLVDLFAKAGVIRWDQEFSLTPALLSSTNLPRVDDDSGFDPAYGAGIQLHFGSIGARLEYEMFDVEDTDAELITLALTWTFL